MGGQMVPDEDKSTTEVTAEVLEGNHNLLTFYLALKLAF